MKSLDELRETLADKYVMEDLCGANIDEGVTFDAFCAGFDAAVAHLQFSSLEMQAEIERLKSESVPRELVDKMETELNAENLHYQTKNIELEEQLAKLTEALELVMYDNRDKNFQLAKKTLASINGGENE